MAGELKHFFVSTIFACTGAISSLLVWHGYRALLDPFVGEALDLLSMFSLGLIGPVVVWLLVGVAARRTTAAAAGDLRTAAAAGLAVVFAAELAFYVPIGVIAIAFAGS